MGVSKFVLKLRLYKDEQKSEIFCSSFESTRYRIPSNIKLTFRNVGYMLRIDCWEAEKDLKTTPVSDCALTSLAVDEPLEYARLYLEGNLQMWVDAENSLEL